MRTAHLFSTILVLTAVAGPAAAQEPTPSAAPLPSLTTATRRQDISLFSQYNGPGWNDGSSSIQGLLYRRVLNKHPQTYWRAGVGTGTGFSSLSFTQPSTSDTAVEVTYLQNERILLASFGAETERQLWRGLYLTAGLEIQAGGSSGSRDSTAQKIYPVGTATQFSSVTSVPFADTRSYFGTGLGFLGMRGYTGRFTAAFELFTGARAGINSQRLVEDRPGVARNFSIFDFSAFGFGSRVLLGYRF